MPPKTFLRARWENLLMANYPVDPKILQPYLPHGTELDFWEDRCYVSLVGFLFLDTRVMGVPIPLHRNFEEVNLRFYVRFRAEGEWRRGVVFIREIVPRFAIATVANTLYGERYISLPMAHVLQRAGEDLAVEYRWRFRGRWNFLRALTSPRPQLLDPGSEAAFITEHYWGYTHRGRRLTSAYQVEHPAWRIFPVRRFSCDIDTENLYGPEFVSFLQAEPASVFVAEGSEIVVRQRFHIRG